MLDLAGSWRFALDREDAGIAAQWQSRALPDRIELPGNLQAQGYGDPISAETPWVLSLYDRNWHLRAPYQKYAEGPEVKVPFLSQPPRHYLGAAWYQRDIEIPAGWAGKRVTLLLERARWKTTAWIDDREIGSQDSLVAPHEFELGVVAPGRHRLTVRVDNRDIVPGYRPDAHAVSDSLGSTWNGIAGRIELRATSPVWIDDAQVFSDAMRRTATVKVTLGNTTGRAGRGTLRTRDVTVPVSWTAAERNPAVIEVAFPAAAALWSEFTPVTHSIALELTGDGASDTREVAFGFRDFTTEGVAFLLNGREINMRGTHHGGDFPLTGHPETDVDYWRDLFRTCRAWGLNHMRFHSFCPPEAAFTAADEIGFYLQPECGMWNVINPDSEMERRMYEETERMLRAYGNHPSFMLFSPSNEPGGRFREALPKWVAHFRERDSRRLHTTGTGWALLPRPGPANGAVDYFAVHRFDPPNVMRGARAWFGGDYGSAMAGVDVPNIVHETGQWCAYPDFGVIEKFTGYMRPGNFAIARDWAAAKGLLERNEQLARASGKLQLACYKEEIEANFRTKELRGFQLLDLHDYLGQGTALVGVLDAFWEEKSYVTADEWRRFCAPTVPLARLERRVFTADETLTADVEMVHFGAAPLRGARPQWRVQNAQGEIVGRGTWPARDIALGAGIELGRVELALAGLKSPAMYRLFAGLADAGVENDWNFWVFPAGEALAATPAGVSVTPSWDDAEALLAQGARVLFLPRPADLDWTCPPLSNVPVFWNRLMGPNWDRMLGLWVDAEHPALAQFPTESFGDWQWIELVSDVRAVNLDRLPPALQPIVQPVDDWNRNYKLGLVWEATVGAGRLLVCAIDLETDLSTRPVARQLRESLLRYMESDAFRPAVTVTPSAVRTFLFDTRVMAHLGATIEGPGNAAALIDGDPNRFWQVGGGGRGRRGGGEASGAPPPQHPFEVTVSFPQPADISGLVVMPRQNQREHQGDIREYVVAVSEDGSGWIEVARGELESSFDPQTIRFAQTIPARKVRFTALSGFGNDRTVALAELAVIHEGPRIVDSDSGEVRYERATSATPEIEEGTGPVRR